MGREVADFFTGIGARLAITRNETGLSQTEMAKEIGVSLRAYHSYEKGDRGLPIEALHLQLINNQPSTHTSSDF